MPLQFVPVHEIPTTQNVLLYGPPGAGKTTGALSAPGPIMYVNAERPTAARFARTRIAPDSLREVWLKNPLTNDSKPEVVLAEAYRYLRAPGCDVRTVVVDSLGEVFRILLEDIARGGNPTLPQFGTVTTKVERLCRSLCELPVNTILIAHELMSKDDELGHFERLPFTGTSSPKLGIGVMAMTDIVGYCGRVAGSDGGDDVYLAQLVTASGRRGKDGSGTLGKMRPVDLTEWIHTAATGTPIKQENQ